MAQKHTPAERVTSLRMPADLRQRAKVYAAKSDTSLQAVVVAALEEYLKKRGA